MMKSMKRFLVPFLLVVFSAVIFQPVPVYAQSQPLCPPGNFGHLCNLRVDKAGGLVGSLVGLLIIIAILVSLFFLVYGGIRYISSGGDKGKLGQARGTLLAAVIGLIIALLAFFIVNIILVFLTGSGLSSVTIPTLLQ